MTRFCVAPSTSRQRRKIRRYPVAAATVLVILSTAGCAVTPLTLSIKGRPTRLTENTILKTDTASVVSQSQLISGLAASRVIYVGEIHNNPSHHAIQLKIIKALAKSTPHLMIGMEMFDHTYQPVLDQWSAGKMDEATFLRRTHWYVNWRFDFSLYRDILEYAKKKRLRIIALNIPFDIPPKIRIGGIDSLTAVDRRQLPAAIDTGNAAHRAYMKKIFRMHAFAFGGHANFEYFYEAQCAWEDSMAQAIADYLGSGRMVVLAGDGHIIRKFGIPDRAFALTHAPFKTIYLAPVDSEADLDWADYIWATPN
jgi:uncharacterized iron-regulated protein